MVHDGYKPTFAENHGIPSIQPQGNIGGNGKEKPVECDESVGKFSKPDFVKPYLETGYDCLMTDAGVKPDARTHSKSSFFILVGNTAHIHVGVVRRRKDDFKCLERIGGNLKTPCKVIAGTSRNISERDFGEIPDSVYHFIDSSISAEDDKGMLSVIRSKLFGILPGMFLILRKENSIVNLAFLELRFDLRPKGET